MKKCFISLLDEVSTDEFGASVARNCNNSSIFYLLGDFGAGKTTFSRGFLRALGYYGKVKSPTYTLVVPYLLRLKTVYHFDLYRLSNAEELEFIGIRDYFDQKAIFLVEWPQRGEGILPKADIELYFSYHQEGRKVQLIARSDDGFSTLDRLYRLDTKIYANDNL